MSCIRNETKCTNKLKKNIAFCVKKFLNQMISFTVLCECDVIRTCKRLSGYFLYDIWLPGTPFDSYSSISYSYDTPKVPL